MTTRIAAAVCLALLPATAAFAQMSVEEMQPVIAQAIQAAGCVMPMEEGERLMAEQMSIILDVPWEDLLDEDGVYYNVIDDAVEVMMDAGTIIVDMDAETVSLANCG